MVPLAMTPVDSTGALSAALKRSQETPMPSSILALVRL